MARIGEDRLQGVDLVSIGKSHSDLLETHSFIREKFICTGRGDGEDLRYEGDSGSGYFRYHD